MKKISIFLLCVIAIGSILTGCGSQEKDLVSITPFPEFSEMTVDGKRKILLRCP